MQLQIRQAGEDVTVEVHRTGDDWVVRWGEREVALSAALLSDGGWLFTTPQGRRRAWIAARGDERYLFCGGRTSTFVLPDPGTEAADEEGVGVADLVADMPGKIVKLLVASGEAVTAGQALIIVESMKMETELAAAVAGTVGTIHVEAGQVVAQGDPLVDVEPDA